MKVCAIAVVLVITAGVAHGDQVALPPGRHVPKLRMRRPIDLSVTGVGAALWIGSEAFKADIVSSSCNWCDRDASGASTLNGFDAGVRDALRWHDTNLANALSNVTGFALAPAVAFGLTAVVANHDGRVREWADDALIIAETTALSVDLNQLVKFAVMRERPFVHALPAAERPHTANPADNNLSFYSGHTTLTFTLAVAAGTVATLRQYRWAWIVWSAGLATAATTGWLRIAADKHYAIDVLTGAILGAGFGAGVPWLAHRADDKYFLPYVMAVPISGGGMATASWRF